MLGRGAILVLLAACAPLHQAQALPQICASMSSVSGSSLTLATAGVAHTFTITARDDAGIPVALDAGATFVARLCNQAARATVQHTPGAVPQQPVPLRVDHLLAQPAGQPAGLGLFAAGIQACMWRMAH